ncbi:hypothetical protein Pint_32084 [Pistacia integerrima]|uniref:Uncharacterized protein n=1 Tax=Pistacia integerrima TaxID=434235 RepID=A0ACC0XPD2_9ROSI|nr:hypothetical protein Pint_32084 [Pistacia integerrima]
MTKPQARMVSLLNSLRSLRILWDMGFLQRLLISSSMAEYSRKLMLPSLP